MENLLMAACDITFLSYIKAFPCKKLSISLLNKYCDEITVFCFIRTSNFNIQANSFPESFYLFCEEWTSKSDFFCVHISKQNVAGSWEQICANIDVKTFSDSVAHTIPIRVIIFINCSATQILGSCSSLKV